MHKDQESIIQQAQTLVEDNTFLCVDVETTGLKGQIVSIGIANAEGELLWKSLIKPTIPVEEGARKFHHLSDEELRDAPSIMDVWPAVFQLLSGKSIVFYNATFDLARISTSLKAYSARDLAAKRYDEDLWQLETYCAMEWFKVIYGEWSDYYEDYKRQSLATACAYFQIPFTRAHTADGDAWATAQVVQAIARMIIPGKEEVEEKSRLGEGGS